MECCIVTANSRVKTYFIIDDLKVNPNVSQNVDFNQAPGSSSGSSHGIILGDWWQVKYDNHLFPGKAIEPGVHSVPPPPPPPLLRGGGLTLLPNFQKLGG